VLNIFKTDYTFQNVPEEVFLSSISSCGADSELLLLFLAYSITMFYP